MSYWNTKGKNIPSIDSFGLGGNSQTAVVGSEFYELEPAVVLDIVIDDKHPIFSRPTAANKVDIESWPEDLSGKPPLVNDLDYSWIGRALVRPLVSQKNTEKDKLVWAYPLENNISDYPLVNEVVVIVRYGTKIYYSRKLNSKNFPNNNLDFSINSQVSGQPNTEYGSPNAPFKGPKSTTKKDGGYGFEGVAGKYFIVNPKIRAIKRFEGDTVIESRFGQSIRFSTYTDNRQDDNGKYTDYANGGGNPMILIRNRQRQLVEEGKQLKPHDALPAIEGTKQEKNAGGYLPENINHDGTSIHITSGKTISQWKTTCYKSMFGVSEEVGSFQGSTGFKYPELSGDQMVIYTDRIIVGSRYGETFHYAKKRYAVVTDQEYTVDAHDQIVMTTNNKMVINSPAIYLGEYDVTGEPAMLGQTAVNWLYDLCEWLEKHTHWHKHSHKDAGKESPSKTQLPVELQALIALKNRLHTLLSRRVFITGGGFAPGKNGGNIKDGSQPIRINVSSGAGVPGGWKGANKR